MTAIPFFDLGGGMSLVPALFKDLGSHHAVILFLQKGMLVHMKRHLSLLSFRLAFRHILNTLSSVAFWSLSR